MSPRISRRAICRSADGLNRHLLTVEVPFMTAAPSYHVLVTSAATWVMTTVVSNLTPSRRTLCLYEAILSLVP